MANTRETVTQTYEGESIQCAKIVVNDTADLKLPGICPINDSYIFQLVAKADAARTITVKVGNLTDTITLSTTFVRYVVPFSSVNVTTSNDVVITFPNGTYYLYNLQLERALNASGWRPAPEDSEDYTDAAEASAKGYTDEAEANAKAYANSQVNALDTSLDQLNVFNRLTNNGQTQGIYLQNGKVYINASYMKTGTLNASEVSVENLNASNIVSGILTGLEINNGSGTFHVDTSGNVTANSLSSTNATITGGSVNITSSGASVDRITLTYGQDKAGISPTLVYVSNTNNHRALNMSADGISLLADTSTTPKKDAVVLSRNGTINSYSDGVARIQLLAALGMIQINDSNGTTRVSLSSTGLRFYDSSGNLTKTYSAT